MAAITPTHLSGPIARSSPTAKKVEVGPLALAPQPRATLDRVRRDQSLSVRQIQVLQWIAAGCPDGVWRDFTYKTTAYALAARGLVKIDRRRKQWSATATEDGEFYLAMGRYPTERGPADGGGSSTETHSDADDLAVELLTALMAQDGQIIVPSPSERQRSRYRRAIHRLIIGRQIPQGFVLRHTGRDRGDLTIRLVPDTEEPRPEPAPDVVVPLTMSEVTSAVRVLCAETRMAVTELSMDRALRILQAIADESAKRGWVLERDPNDDRRFRISTNECHLEMSLSEELVDRELPDEELLREAKHAWQRIPLHTRKVGSGRLTLQLGQYWQRKSWSDRRRWALDDKLSAAFIEFERRDAEAAEQRRRREDDLLRRQQDWDAAVVAAKQGYVVDLNRRRLRDQVANHNDAQAFRGYAEILGTVAERSGDPAKAQSIRRWQQWVNDEATRVDPINKSDALHYLEPDTVRPEDYEPFMPKGMSALRRPTQ